MNKISETYGKALFSLAEEKNKILPLLHQAQTVLGILLENEDFTVILSSAFLTLNERLALIDKDFSGIDIDLLNFLKVIVVNRRGRYLIDILKGFISFANASLGIKEGILYSTLPVSEKVKQTIEEKLALKEKAKVYLTNKIDPSLIGGMKIVIDGHIYDDSLKARLGQMHAMLLNKEDAKNEY